MEGKRLNSKPRDLLKKIRYLAGSILEDLCKGRSPLIYIDRFRNYCTDATGTCCCNSDLPMGKEVLTLQRECHARRLDVLLRVLLIVQQLLQENRHGSKRDIYYMHPSVFREQSVVDRAINDICILMQCSRHNLNIVSAGKGLVMGWLRFSEGGRKFDCINNPNTAHPVPVHVEDVKDIIGVAQYILVVEKESVFQRLANDQFCKRNRCIVITGRGYPDVPTRRFLRLLIGNLRLPVYCLVDCDPYGFDILATYRFGSMQMAYDAKFLRIPEIRWLGAFPSDSEKCSLPHQCLLPLTAEDKARTEALLLRCYLQREEPQWRTRDVIFLFPFLGLQHIRSDFSMDSYADMVCLLKVNVHCEACKMNMMAVLGSICGVYSVTVDAQKGTIEVSGEVDPNILLRALGRSGKHAELVWMKLKHPTLNKRPPYYTHNNNSIYGPSSSYSYGAIDEPSYYNVYRSRRPLALPQGSYYHDTHQHYYPQTRQPTLEHGYSYYDTHQHYYPQTRQPTFEYAYPSYSTNYRYDSPLPQAQYMASAPQPMYDQYDDEPISFCSIM